ncbi:Bordetella pertussis Bvg accessory factor [Candidatus Omnitrophus magneticus]|uniref:Type III pantothenate kinase n=1 Tax=Candidatus Omnitrophus magneticus TaxID=1609969 RepID=A0A0F0CWX4_9BACT|nr:Bordetella pertussis Bvg accessory factor [Candidatus Omnitrophus magneticus]
MALPVHFLVYKKEINMRLLIDIGNTNTSMALVDGNVFVKHYFIHTAKKEISKEAFTRMMGRYIKFVDKIIVVSVVPYFLSILISVLKKVFLRASISIVGRDMKVPIKNKYNKPNEVGQDRLVTAFAAKLRYKAPLIAIDFGTAVTLDFVNKRGDYEGGFIFPGLRLSLKSLVSDTSLLPSIVLKSSKGFIGKDTKTSMNNGILFGYAALCDGLIERITEKYGKVNVAATGGDAALVAKNSKYIKHVHPKLIFEGLKEIT